MKKKVMMLSKLFLLVFLMVNIFLFWKNFVSAASTTLKSSNVSKICDVKDNRIDCSWKWLNSIKSWAFLSFTWVTEINLSSNNLKKLPKNIFLWLDKLVTLDLSNNALTGFDNVNLQSLKKLERLSLSDNELTSISDWKFSNLINLKNLSLRSNKITKITRNVFSWLKSLTYLDFSDNPLEEIDKRVLSNLSKLSEVSLTYPKHPVAWLFSSLNYLSSIIIEWEIKKIDEWFFSWIEDLDKLIIIGNWKNADISKWDFTGLKSLRKLSISNIKVKNLNTSSFVWLDNLRELSLSFEKLNDIQPWVFIWLDNLEELYIWLNWSQNKYPFIRWWTFNWLKSLDRLELNWWKIEKIDNGAFVELEKLRNIRITFNSMDSVPEWLFSSLTNLTHANINFIQKYSSSEMVKFYAKMWILSAAMSWDQKDWIITLVRWFISVLVIFVLLVILLWYRVNRNWKVGVILSFSGMKEFELDYWLKDTVWTKIAKIFFIFMMLLPSIVFVCLPIFGLIQIPKTIASNWIPRYLLWLFVLLWLGWILRYSSMLVYYNIYNYIMFKKNVKKIDRSINAVYKMYNADLIDKLRDD